MCQSRLACGFLPEHVFCGEMLVLYSALLTHLYSVRIMHIILGEFGRKNCNSKKNLEKVMFSKEKLKISILPPFERAFQFESNDAKITVIRLILNALQLCEVRSWKVAFKARVAAAFS